MAENLELILKIAVLVFIAGTLFRIGLEIDFGSALRGLGDGIFILNAAFFGFVVGLCSRSSFPAWCRSRSPTRSGL